MHHSIVSLSRAAAALVAATTLSGCGAYIASLGQQHGPTTAEANRPALKAARNALEEGNAATALAIAHGVLASEPNNLAALVAAGNADVQLGNRRTAEKEYRQALTANANYTPARIGLGKLKMRDDIKGAEADFRAVLANTPNDAAALTDLGVTLDLQERHKEAQAAYTAAINANPDLTSARVNLGLSLALSGDPTRAEQVLHDATESGPVPAKVRADLAVAEVLEGRPEVATETLEADLSVDEAKASVQAMSGLAPAAAQATKKN
jgi:Flp pilus assembly protein TadD